MYYKRSNGKARGELSDFYCHMHQIAKSPQPFLVPPCRNVIRYNGRQSRHTLSLVELLKVARGVHGQKKKLKGKIDHTSW